MCEIYSARAQLPLMVVTPRMHLYALVGGVHARSGAVRDVRLNVDASFLPTARRRARRVGGGVRFSTVRCLAVKTNADGAQGFGIRFMDS